MVSGLLIVVASLASVVVAHGLSRCGTQAQLLRGMWDLPGPGTEPVSPALAGGFLTTVPPGKPHKCSLKFSSSHIKNVKRQVKLILNNTFYLILYIKAIII